MPFNAIVGHHAALRILRSMLQTRQVPHAFIFSGIEGIGKHTAALAFVKALNCATGDDDFCDQCLSCRKIERTTHPDVINIEPQKNVIRIEQVRSMQEELAFKPLEAKKKAVIINQAETLNLNAANCLLKTLEEPPEDSILILVACSTAGMLPTVLSRCQIIQFSPLADTDVAQLLIRENNVDTHTAERVTQHAHGSIKRALFLLESRFFAERNEIAKMLAADLPESMDTVLHMAKRLSSDSQELPLILEFLQGWYRDLLFCKSGVSDTLLYNRDILECVQQASARETKDGILKKLKRIRWLQDHTVLNIDMQLGLESVFLQ